MRLVVGQKVILRRVIATLNKPSDPSTDLELSQTQPFSPKAPLPLFKLEDELAKIEAEFNESPTVNSQPFTPPDQALNADAQPASTSPVSTGSQGKPLLPSDLIYGSDGKQLKLLQFTFAQFILANLKILESLLNKNPAEASDYLKYLRFLVCVMDLSLSRNLTLRVMTVTLMTIILVQRVQSLSLKWTSCSLMS